MIETEADIQAGLMDIHRYYLGCGHVQWTCIPPAEPPAHMWCKPCNIPDAVVMGWEADVVREGPLWQAEAASGHPIRPPLPPGYFTEPTDDLMRYTEALTSEAATVARDYLRSCNLDRADAERLGLGYDEQSGRLMMPVRNQDGQVFTFLAIKV